MELLLRRSISRDGKETVDHVISARSAVLAGDERSDFLISALPGRLVVALAGRKGLSLKSKGAPLSVQGKPSRKVILAAGEQAEFCGLELRVFEPPSGFDAGLEVIGECSALQGRSGLLRDVQPWSMRRLSWGLVIVLSLLLAIPLLARYDALAFLKTLPGIPGDALWSTGPLAAAHQAAGLSDNCGACHQTPFRMVADTSCMGCHEQTHEHIDPLRFPRLAMHEERCASCHREHNEPEWLVTSDDRMCTACHAEPGPWRDPAAENPHAVAAFTGNAHPQFRLSMWEPRESNAALGWELVRTRIPAAQLSDASALKFNHEVHLDGAKVSDANSDEALVCASCHRLEDDGEHFASMSMDADCRHCHELNFDPFDPDIELPHGNTRAAFEAMEAHFIREFTDPILRAERVQQKPRRLPGKRMSAASCEGNGLDCGRQEAVREAAYQFADTGCVTCHEVEDSGASAAIDRWTVHPVKLTQDWYSQSRFDHSSHLSLDGARGDEVCETCHDSATSDTARDVLIPGRDNCLECHSTEARRAPAQCTACHSLHRNSSPVVATTRRGVLP